MEIPERRVQLADGADSERRFTGERIDGAVGV